MRADALARPNVVAADHNGSLATMMLQSARVSTFTDKTIPVHTVESNRCVRKIHPHATHVVYQGTHRPSLTGGYVHRATSMQYIHMEPHTKTKEKNKTCSVAKASRRIESETYLGSSPYFLSCCFSSIGTPLTYMRSEVMNSGLATPRASCPGPLTTFETTQNARHEGRGPPCGCLSK